jgi:hypothetical protein
MRVAVPITPYLLHRAFEPELIREMSAAFDAACAGLRLNPTDDAATRLVAEKVVELAQRGFNNAEALVRATLAEFGVDDERSSGR